MKHLLILIGLGLVLFLMFSGGMHCKCEKYGGIGAKCSVNTDCSQSLSCIAGQCLVGKSPYGRDSCTTDAQCGPGGKCGPDGQCQHRFRPGISCNTDSNCRLRYGACSKCINGSCSPMEGCCKTDYDCGFGGHCVDGRCT